MYRVLVVDNDSELRTFARNALRDEEFEVDTSSNAVEAYELLGKHHHAIMLLDLNLPRTDGYEVLRTVREERRYELMSIVVMSGSNDLETKIKSLDQGAIDFIAKPIHPQELAARIRALVRLRQRQDSILEEYQKLSELTLTDPLTGAYNRRAMESLLGARLSESLRYNIPISCVMVDIDHFKEVNDAHGHGVGDLVLREIAEVALAQTRQEDALIRYGGEEFLLILFHTTKEGAANFAERLRMQTENHIFIKDHQALKITLSAGTATHPEDVGATDVDSMIALADQRLYAAKRAGRNKVVSEE